MSSSSPARNLLEVAAYHFEQNRPLLPMYLHLIISALFPIYTGAYASLSRPSSAAKPDKSSSPDVDEDDDDDEEEEADQKMEGLSPKDAVIFPVLAGVVLTGLYFAIKRYGADLINLILGVYFSLIGTFSVAKLINDAWSTIEGFITPTYYRANGKIWRVKNSERKVVALHTKDGEPQTRSTPLAGPLVYLPLPKLIQNLVWSVRDLTKQKFVVQGFAKNVFDFRTILTRHNVISAFLGITAIAYSLFVGKPWWLTNLQGFAVSYGALQLMSPTTFATGTLILSGLFFYDIWAVFFTPLMVTVAKNLDVPIKLVFPRPEEPSTTPGAPPVRSYSMLGLGDIVLPGLVIAMALRFDLYMFYLRQQKPRSGSSVVGKTSKADEDVIKVPYWTATGHWGDHFWTAGAASSPEAKHLPTYLTKSFPKPYFIATTVGYTIGMVATLIFMSIFQHAQPALLYLVPAVLLSLWGTGLVRRELKFLWNFTEAFDMDSTAVYDSKSDKVPKDACQPEDKSLGEEKSASDVASQSAKEVTRAAKDDQKATSGVKPDPDSVFSFTISHHNQKARSSRQSTAAPAENADRTQASPEQNSPLHEELDTLSDDAVLVSTADLGTDTKASNGSRR